MKRVKNQIFRRVWNEKGGIALIIATIVSIVLVLGLIAYAILSQVAGVKAMGDQSNIEQDKVSQMIQDPNTVTGNTVKSYASQASSTFTVKIKNTGESTETYNTAQTSLSIKDNAIYEMSKSYSASGELDEVSFVQVDLSR